LLWVLAVLLVNVFYTKCAPTPQATSTAAAVTVSDSDAWTKGGFVAGNDPRFYWPKGELAYKVASDFSDTQRSEIIAACDEFSKLTCMKFKLLNSNDPTPTYSIEFQKHPTLCATFDGRPADKGVPQKVYLSSKCELKGEIMHYIMHVLTFIHEELRPDRDQYVKIELENAKDEKKREFDIKDKATLLDLGTPYDYESIMHSPKFEWSKPELSMMPTIVTLQPTNGVEIGQRQKLSKWDIVKVNRLYCENRYPAVLD